MTLTKKQHLAEKRTALGLTLRQVAYQVGIDDGAVSRWERFETEPHPEFRAKYASALRITVEELGRIVYLGRQEREQAKRRRSQKTTGRIARAKV